MGNSLEARARFALPASFFAPIPVAIRSARSWVAFYESDLRQAQESIERWETATETGWKTGYSKEAWRDLRRKFKNDKNATLRLLKIRQDHLAMLIEKYGDGKGAL